MVAVTLAYPARPTFRRVRVGRMSSVIQNR